MHRIYRLLWNQLLTMFVVPVAESVRSRGRSSRIRTRAAALTALMMTGTAQSETVLDLSAGLEGWTTLGRITITGTTHEYELGAPFGTPAQYSITPASGHNMARITPEDDFGPVNSQLGLSAGAIENFLAHERYAPEYGLTDFGIMSRTIDMQPGIYSFAWAYAAEDYQPYDDGVLFTLVGGGSETLVSLARNGYDESDTSGPSPGTLVLGSFGSTAWNTAYFTIATAGPYQLGFAVYNRGDLAYDPNLYISRIAGSFTGIPVVPAGGGGATIIGLVGGNISDSVFDPASTAYAQPTLGFAGGTLVYPTPGTTTQNAVLDALGGTIDTAGNEVHFSGAFFGVGSLVKTGAGTLELSGANAFTGSTTVASGTLALSGAGSLESSSEVLVEGTLDISATDDGASIKSLAGSGTVALGNRTLVISAASGTFSGSVQGEGVLAIAGGTLTLDGVSSHTGGTLVSGGARLGIASDGALGDGSTPLILSGGVLDTTGTFTLDRNVVVVDGSIDTDTGSTLTVAGDVSGGVGGCFRKEGAGKLVMSGEATLGNGTCVLEGALHANGVLNSTVTVESAGTLRGTGTIGGPVSVQGTLAPGNSPGLLIATGSVVMADGSTYQQDINGVGLQNGPGGYSRLLITGADSQFFASGATLRPSLLNIMGSETHSPYVPQVGDVFRIVSAEGGIVGEFDELVQPEGLAAGTRFDVYYDMAGSDSIDLLVVPVSYAAFLQSMGVNENARSAAGVLDYMAGERGSGTASAEQEELVYAAGSQAGSDLAALTTALAGEVHGALAAAAPLAHRWLLDSVGQQLGSTPGDSREPAPGRGVWADIAASHGDWNADSAASGFDIDRTQVATGIDLLVDSASRLGIGFTHADLDVSAAAGAGSVAQNVVFVYGRHGLGRVRLDGLLGYGVSDWQTDRADPLAPSTTLRTDLDGRNVLAATGISSTWKFHHLAVEPYGRVTWEKVERDAFEERPDSVASLAAPAFSASGSRLTTGIRAGRDFAHAGQGLGLQLDLGAGLDDADLVRPSMAASLSGMPTEIRTPRVGRGYLRGTFLATARFNERSYGYFAATGEARSGTAKELGAKLGFRMML